MNFLGDDSLICDEWLAKLNCLKVLDGFWCTWRTGFGCSCFFPFIISLQGIELRRRGDHGLSVTLKKLVSLLYSSILSERE